MIETNQDRAHRLLAEDQERRRLARSVNHAAPICDEYCRCRDCKPAPKPDFAAGSATAICIAALILLWAMLVRAFH
jgi:hypothetical protein